MVSVTSISRSVAFRRNDPSSPRRRTFDKIGMVLRRSTTRCTCPSAFSRAARSTVTLIVQHPFSLELLARIRTPPQRWRRQVERGPRVAKVRPKSKAVGDDPQQGIETIPQPLFLQHALEEFDLVAERGVLAERLLDLADRMQHRGVIASAETPADFRQ